MALVTKEIFKLWLLVSIVNVSSQSCPEPCTRLFSKLVCDGSKVNLTTFPQIENRPWIKSLLVVHTNLPSLQRGELVLPAVDNLRKVALFSNGIKTLGKSIFRNISNITSLALSNNSLSAVPTIAIKPLKKLVFLTLTRNRIQTIESNAFLQNQNLEKLFLDDNRISDIRVGSFNGLDRLIYLHLSNNNIARFPFEGSVQDFSVLEGLYVTGNLIEDIFTNNQNFSACVTLAMQSNSLSHLKNFSLNAFPQISTLSVLDNLIEKLDEFLFGSVYHPLENLIISNNKLSELPIKLLKNLPKLRKLFLAQNKITMIPGKAFLNNIYLQTLDLSFNLIQVSHPSALDGLKSLKFFFVQHNNLSTIPADYFSLSYDIHFRLDGNHWVCDCDLCAVQKWYNKTKYYFGNPVCSVPPRFRGTPIIEVPFKKLCKDTEVTISEHTGDFGFSTTDATSTRKLLFYEDIAILAMLLVFVTGGTLICLSCLCNIFGK
ncbi:Carboxypeptidase N subunit 2 [Holothuria leucospilota]|uniref:Carboxypeptidase N subunit 2 n=1 Tax=Holothuria leucospilota TaxID=206669 RepID=A0A9Q0YQE5_HOLLE|nr:Carboxypeptidase N subunit 2 [Holothuria leucospilota]